MTEAVATERRIIRVPPAVAFGSKFGKYKPEEEKEVRKVEIKEDNVLKKLKAAWKRFRYDILISWEKNYGVVSGQVKRLEYSSKDVENFCIALAEFQGEEHFGSKAGLFLSALINNGKDTDYVIHTQHLNREIRWLGYGNSRNITVNGNTGGWVGFGMKGGSITVHGDVREAAGMEMKGGAIIVDGNATGRVGGSMKGGSITVNGDAGGWVGLGMKGGEIHLEGDCQSLACTREGGRIYHKGKLIWSGSHERTF